MIRNEAEYRETTGRLNDHKKRMARQKSALRKTGLSAAEVKRVLDPMRSFHLQLQEEVKDYERLKRGEFGEMTNLRGFGHLLISLRIASGLSQRQLAHKLNVHESQVSRDERNEYHGITLDRAARILGCAGCRTTKHRRARHCSSITR